MKTAGVVSFLSALSFAFLPVGVLPLGRRSFGDLTNRIGRVVAADAAYARDELSAAGGYVASALHLSTTNSSDPEAAQKNASAVVGVHKTEGPHSPHLGDAWLNEVRNEPNLDAERMLGWDVFRRLENATELAPRAAKCVAGIQREFYDFGERDSLKLQNCVKGSKNVEDQEKCLCVAPFVSHGGNLWKRTGCCDDEVLAFSDAVAEMNSNRTGVVDLRNACAIVCEIPSSGAASMGCSLFAVGLASVALGLRV